MSARIALANETALGTIVFSWTSPSTGIRARIMWGEGMGLPMVCSRPPGGGREITRPVARPERFGWASPAGQSGRRQAAAVRALATAFAAAFEEEMTADDAPADDA